MKKLWYKFYRFCVWTFNPEILRAINNGATYAEVENLITEIIERRKYK